MSTQRKYPAYARLTLNQLAHVLAQRVVDGEITEHKRVALLNAHKQRLEIIRVTKIEHHYLKKRWKHLMNPLHEEMRSVKQAIAYQRKHNQQSAALDVLVQYHTVLTELDYTMRTYRAQRVEPRIAAEEYPRTCGRGSENARLKNNGEHWVDWIAPNVQRAFLTAFADLPPHHGKRREPFVRIRVRKVVEDIGDDVDWSTLFKSTSVKAAKQGDLKDESTTLSTQQVVHE